MITSIGTLDAGEDREVSTWFFEKGRKGRSVVHEIVHPSNYVPTQGVNCELIVCFIARSENAIAIAIAIAAGFIARSLFSFGVTL